MRDVLTEDDMQADELARLAEYTQRHIGRTMNQKADFGAQSAIKIGRVTGTSPSMWIKLQIAWDMGQAEKKLAKWKPSNCS
ncbi:MAG: hypothetical protein Pyrs2KO_30540 [Pyruvatibacter sp.]